MGAKEMSWCELCQTTHSSASCYHPGNIRIGVLEKENKELKAENDKLREALKEILKPTEPDYYLGIRCGVEDRGLQYSSYEAAEYGYDEGKEYCQFIAQQALGENK